MPEEPTNRELKIMLQNVLEKVETGFTGVHERQDATNGNVIKNTKFRWSIMAVTSFCILLGIGNIINIWIK